MDFILWFRGHGTLRCPLLLSSCFCVRFSPLLPLRWWDPLPFFSSILFACFSRVCAPKRNETSARRSLVAVHSSRAVFVFIWQRAGNKLVVAQGITAATLSETGFSVEKLLILRCVFISISVLCCPARAQRQLLPYIIRENREKEREKYVHYVNGCAASHFPFDSISFCLCVAVFRFDFRFFSVLVIPFSWKCSGVSTAIHYTHEWEAWMMHDNTLSIQWIYGTFTVFYLDISPLRAAAVFSGQPFPFASTIFGTYILWRHRNAITTTESTNTKRVCSSQLFYFFFCISGLLSCGAIHLCPPQRRTANNNAIRSFGELSSVRHHFFFGFTSSSWVRICQKKYVWASGTLVCIRLGFYSPLSPPHSSSPRSVIRK